MNAPSPAATKGSVHLNALRGAAALLVFMNHTRALYFPSALPDAAVATAAPAAASVAAGAAAIATVDTGEGTIRVASAAVVIFFVLSGYLVGGGTIRAVRSGRWSWSSYLTKRLVRLLVVLIPAVLIGATLDHFGSRLAGPASIYTAPPGPLRVAADLDARLRPSVLLGNIFFLQGILFPLEGTNVSLWSLANEFWYYIAFPFAVLGFASRTGNLRRVLSVIVACAVVWFMGLHIALLFPIWILGAVVALLPPRLSQASAQVFSWIALAVLVLGVMAVRLVGMASVPAEYIIGVLTATLLYGLIAQDLPSYAGVYRRTSHFLSEVSYSLYLFHLPLAVFLCGLFDSPWHTLPRSAASLAYFAGTDLFIFGLVTLLWWLFEARTDQIRSFVFSFENSARTAPGVVGR